MSKLKGQFGRSSLRCTVALLTLGVATISYGQTGTCTFDPATSKCVVKGGQICGIGNGTGSCGFGENACLCWLPDFTLSVTPPTEANYSSPHGSVNTYQVTVTPAAGGGTLGTINLSCKMTPFGACSLNPTAVVSTGAPVSSTLTANVPANASGTSTITVNASNPNTSPLGGPAFTGPTNGPQSVTLEIAVQTGPFGGGTVALGTFLGLAAMWTLWNWLRRWKIAEE